MKILILAGLILLGPLSAFAQTVSCPNDGLEMDPKIHERIFNEIQALEGPKSEAASNLRDLLKRHRIDTYTLNRIINFLGGENLRARLWKAYPADPAKDELVLVALDNPCAKRFAYAAAAGLARSYGLAELAAPVADEIVQRMLARPALFTDDELRDAVAYVPYASANDAGRLSIYEKMYASPAAGALTLGDIAKAVVLITPDPEGWLEKILHSPLADSYTRTGVGIGIGKSPRLPANAAELLDQILISAAAPLSNQDGRNVLEAISNAIGGASSTIPGEAALLVRGMVLFSEWATRTRNRGLLEGSYVGDAMMALSRRQRRIEGLAEADSVLGTLVAPGGEFSGYLRGLSAQANGGQLTQPEVDSVFLSITPHLSLSNLLTLKNLLKSSNFVPTPALLAALDARATELAKTPNS